MHNKAKAQAKTRRQAARRAKATAKALLRQKIAVVDETPKLEELGFIKVASFAGVRDQEGRWFAYPTATFAIPRGSTIITELVRCNHGVTIGNETLITLKNGKKVIVSENFIDRSTKTIII